MARRRRRVFDVPSPLDRLPPQLGPPAPIDLDDGKVTATRGVDTTGGHDIPFSIHHDRSGHASRPVAHYDLAPQFLSAHPIELDHNKGRSSCEGTYSARRHDIPILVHRHRVCAATRNDL